MGFLVRALRILLVLVLLCAAVLWFAARREDRGYIELEVTIDRRQWSFAGLLATS